MSIRYTQQGDFVSVVLFIITAVCIWSSATVGAFTRAPATKGYISLQPNLNAFAFRATPIMSESMQRLFQTSLLSSSNDDNGAMNHPTNDNYNGSSNYCQKEDSLHNNYLTDLCHVSKQACDIMTPLIRAIYSTLESDDTVKTLKKDNSAFTIADGIVQHLLVEYIFDDISVFGGLVGEEESEDIHLPTATTTNAKPPYKVQNLEIPSTLNQLVEETCQSMRDTISLSSNPNYSSLTVFIDPIDGTREFSSGKGEQCSICIGFADKKDHKPVAGIVYRPLSFVLDEDDNNKKVWTSTWAAGAKSENYFESYLLPPPQSKKEEDNYYLVTSNGSISPFLSNLMEKLNYQRYPSGGAGNKMLLLLENPQSAYILDRGVSRWDTCAAQAVLEAQGGLLVKLDSFFSSKDAEFVEESYTYKVTNINCDMPQNFQANLTKYNSNDNNDNKNGPVTDATMVKDYANICGMLALPKEGNTIENKKRILEGLQQASLDSPPAFD